jgi:hypothetical protein
VLGRTRLAIGITTREGRVLSSQSRFGVRVVNAERFSDEELAFAVKGKDRFFLDRYLGSKGVSLIVREFYMRSKPGREGKTSDAKVKNDRKLARAKLFYKERMRVHGDVKRARAEMTERFPMHIDKAARLTEGNITHINRICDEMSDPVVLKLWGTATE